MAKQGKDPATKSNDLSLIPGIHMRRKELSLLTLSSDLHMCAVAHVCVCVSLIPTTNK